MLNNIFTYNIQTNEFKVQKEDEDAIRPEPRIGHGAFLINDNLYIFGGSLQDGNLLNDLWKLDLNNYIWEKILENNKK